jgi:hypothetical protein
LSLYFVLGVAGVLPLLTADFLPKGQPQTRDPKRKRAGLPLWPPMRQVALGTKANFMPRALARMSPRFCGTGSGWGFPF